MNADCQNIAEGFKNIPEDVWKFHIGGYQVCHKWLKDRRGRPLSSEDIAHYKKIVYALGETIRLMGEVDAAIHPWQSGPTELIAHAIEHLHKETEFDNRIAFLLFDVGIETLFKTYLMLPESTTGAKTSFQKRKIAANGQIHSLEEEKRVYRSNSYRQLCCRYAN